MTFPTDTSALIALIISQLWISALLSWGFSHIPFMRDDTVADWKKLGVAAFLCYAWSLFATFVTLRHAPLSPDEIYGIVVLGTVVLFDNQSTYALINKLPAVRDFILTLFGKPTPSPNG